MKVTFIEHSGFLVELPSCNLIFDYESGQLPPLEKEKPVYVFVSHFHKDHYNPVIFDWRKNYDHIVYIISKDVKKKRKWDNGNDIVVAEPGRKYEVENICVECLKSTDEGVAFIVEADGKQLYHAGDLHWWHWIGEADDWNENMKKAFLKEMKHIEKRHFDVAFVVLDPRQESVYDWGMDYFMRHTDTDLVFPMHFWKDYSVIKAIKQDEKSLPYREKIVDLNNPGQTIAIQSI